jgi:alanine racemase
MRTTRRSFVRGALSLPLAGSALPLYAGAQRHDSGFDPWIEVSAANLRHNATEVSRRVEGRPILAVIKNNGYGLGVETVARILEPLPGIAGFAVVKLQEAHTLLDAGIRKPVLFMGPFGETELQDAAARGIRPMVYTPIGAALDRIAAGLQKKVPLHVCIDTGIGRVGVPYREAGPLVRDLGSRASVTIEGTMMTFTEDPEFDPEQLRRFRESCAAWESAGIRLGRKHAASSFALFDRPDSFLDMVRPGMALYGIYSENRFRSTGVMDLRPALSLKARVIYVKRLAKGESAGYNRAYVASRDVWVATLPVGHADGYPRAAAKGGRVRIGGALYPVIASVSASHSIVEIGPEQRVQAGDSAIFFDAAEGSRPEDLGAATDTSVYDLTMHLSPLLPRQVTGVRS